MPTPLAVVDRPVVASMNFGDALSLLTEGKRVTRLAWPTPDVLLLQGGVVHIQNAKGVHVLQVSDGDILANDWVLAQ